MAQNPKKTETSSDRYKRLLAGEIDAKQYVSSLRQEARGRSSGRYSTSRTSSTRANRAES